MPVDSCAQNLLFICQYVYFVNQRKFLGAGNIGKLFVTTHVPLLYRSIIMYKKPGRLISSVIILLVGGCSLLHRDDNNGPDNTADSTLTTEAAQTITPAGGTVTVSAPESPINGLSIQVPPGAYGTPVTMTVAWKTLDTTVFPDGFSPVTPFISITDGGGYADSAITVNIPCAVPDGHFAMAFFANPSTGELEGIPILDYDASSVTAVTRTFGAGQPLQQKRKAVDLWGIVVGTVERFVFQREFHKRGGCGSARVRFAYCEYVVQFVCRRTYN
jgi:hypothetical protein